MNIFVCIKQVPDTETIVTPNSDGSFIDLNSIKWIINPYDEFALEEAVKLKEKTKGTLTAIRVGKTHDTEALRTAIAFGADEAILVDAEDNLGPFLTATAIHGAIEKSGKKPDIIFMGKQAVDSDNLQVPGILSELLNIPSITFVIGFDQDDNKLTLKRESEGGVVEVYEVASPAIIACQKGLNTPRYPALPKIMKAKKAPITTLSLGDVGADLEKRLIYSNFHLPQEKPPGKNFEATDEGEQKKIVSEVVNLLRTEAKVI